MANDTTGRDEFAHDTVDESTQDANASVTGTPANDEASVVAQRENEPQYGGQGREAELEAQVADLNARLLRTQADFENLRRRSRQEREELLQYGTSRLIESLLPTLDNFERAMGAARMGDGSADTLIKGLEMVWREMLTALEREGLRPMNVVGEAFDPTLHEAVMQVQDESLPSGQVVEELRRGYFLKEKVLRAAMVKVNQ